MTYPTQCRNGLTLVELLVVLLILSILSVVAVQSTDQFVDQGRYDATQQTLRNIEEAILGPANQRQPDGTMLISGFVADIGRPPLKYGTDPLTQLQELWDNDKDKNGVPDLLPFAVRAAPSDSEVLVPGGWRAGGYLRLPVGVTLLRDGWGNAFDLGPSGPATTIDSVRSKGSDGLANESGGGTTGYAPDTMISITPDRYMVLSTLGGRVAGNVYVLDQTGVKQNPSLQADETIVVRFYSPDATIPAGVIEDPLTIAGPRDSTMATLFQFTNKSIGPRSVRAYLIKTGTVPEVKNRSPIARIMVQPGGQTLDLVMPHVTTP